ncbi:MAG: UDP-2,3-diacylglucosamine diphosphatase LpxI [Alphaproteobacteria bacterium]|nr:UDP-2,3-diacylglucosamine diphosphatase LpxI [Alphaproteobacteria bacterium]
MAAKLGILAGGGPLPGYLIEACRSSGRDYFVLAFEDHADPVVIGAAPQAWVRLGAVEEAIGRLRAEHCEELVLAGPVRRPSLADLRPDRRAARLLARGILSKGDNGLLGAVVRFLEEEEGFRVVGADAILADLRAAAGPFGRHAPTTDDEADILRGVDVVYQIGRLDIGQSAVVRQGVVLGVEAAEGTEALLNRCGSMRGDNNGGVLVKLPKPGQEKRADLPAIGPKTVAGAVDAGLAGIAVAAGGTLVFDPTRVVADADAGGLFIVGIKPDDYHADYDVA